MKKQKITPLGDAGVNSVSPLVTAINKTLDIAMGSVVVYSLI